MAAKAPVINGWEIYVHPLFFEQYLTLKKNLAVEKSKNQIGYKKSNAAKKFYMLLKVGYELIPSDPTNRIFYQGNTLGEKRKIWHRAKYLQQYRLFFRYRIFVDRKIIILAWVNDANSLRAYGSKTDAYLVFSKMLDSGNPPDDWDELLAASIPSPPV